METSAVASAADTTHLLIDGELIAVTALGSSAATSAISGSRFRCGMRQ